MADGEWAYVAGKMTEAALRDLYRNAGYKPDQVERRLDALTPLAA